MLVVVYFLKFRVNVVAQVPGLEQAILSTMMLLIAASECVSGDLMQPIRSDAVVSKMSCSLALAYGGLWHCLSVLFIS